VPASCDRQISNAAGAVMHAAAMNGEFAPQKA
jgi:hypothetical protein